MEVLSQWIVHLINFCNVYTLTYQKTLLHTLFYLILKSSKSFNVSLNRFYFLIPASNENNLNCSNREVKYKIL